jgi:tRNA threonylcarbamoyladenosine biosynthesis protein TsaB
LITLTLETALGACSVAVGDEERVLAARYEERAEGQAERLIPMMDEVLREAGLSPAALQRIGVTIGPGSFTGTRIGLAASRALGLARGIPVIGLTTLDALALETQADGPVLVAFDARRGQLSVQMFAGDAARMALSPALALTREEAASRLPEPPGALTLTGSGAEALAEALPPARFAIARIAATPFPKAAGFLCEAARRPAPKQMPRPFYLRAADAAAPAERAS